MSLDAVKEVLKKCPSISSINLSSCRGLPRGVKRLLQGTVEITELKETLGVIEKQPKPTVKVTDVGTPSTTIVDQSTSPSVTVTEKPATSGEKMDET